MLADLHRFGWHTDLVFQMTCKRAQPLETEILLALCPLRDTAPLGTSPLVEDANVVLSLRFYFLTARIPLATRASAAFEWPRAWCLALRRPTSCQAAPTCCLLCFGRLDRATAAAGTSSLCLMRATLLLSPPLASLGEQPKRRTQGPRIYKQLGPGTQVPCLFWVWCFWFVVGSFLVTARVGIQAPEEAMAPVANLLSPTGYFLRVAGAMEC